ncbi:Retrovirus-related Pol polyprotein from transposon TNT 1-94 [Senna tora]|uniref:Retrovirus-related Pol polyprotein from transposon TNT 1-94 n=1 Tax=Senna tora TaxID=362788 RepID=A0A834T0J8_9FABA|nr:Retrovirus-related Pol polyprotein from transposon TNT 1-94 [Senna tora]
MAEKADLVDPKAPQSSSTSSIPLIEKEKKVIAFNHNLSVKLDDKNYLLWRHQILAALEGHDLEKYITGSRFVPPKFDTEGDREAGKLSLNYLNWKKQDKLILSWLLGSMTESMLTHVNECEHSYEAWNIMIEQLGINTKTRVHLYKTELRGIKKANMKSDLTSIGELEALLVAHEVRMDQSLKAVKTTDTPSAKVASVDHKEKNNQNKNNQPGPFRAFNNFRGGRNGGGRFNNYRGGFGRDKGGSNFNQGFNRPFVVCQQYSQNFTQARQRFSRNISAMVATPDAMNDAAWFLDTGTTNHVTFDASNLMNGVEYSGSEQLHMGNGKGLLISNIGQLLATKATLLKGSIRPDGLYYFTDFKLLHQSSQPACAFQSYDSSINSCSSSASPIVLASTIGTSVSNSVTSNCTAVTPYTLWHCRLASPYLVVQYETSINPITVTNIDNCIVSTNKEVCDGSVSTGVDGSAKSHGDGNNSASSVPKAMSSRSISNDQAPNVHSMVTRAKAGVFKPKILLAHMGKYIQDLLVKSKMDGACAISTPMVSNAKLSKDGRVESVSVDMKDNKLILTGDIDPVSIVGKLRKICHTHIVSVGPAKEEKKEEPKKAEEKKGEGDKKPEIKLVPYDHVYGYNYNYNYYPMRPHQYYYARTVEEDPNACVIC